MKYRVGRPRSRAPRRGAAGGGPEPTADEAAVGRQQLRRRRGRVSRRGARGRGVPAAGPAHLGRPRGLRGAARRRAGGRGGLGARLGAGDAARGPALGGLALPLGLAAPEREAGERLGREHLDLPHSWDAFTARYTELRAQYPQLPPTPWGVYMGDEPDLARHPERQAMLHAGLEVVKTALPDATTYLNILQYPGQ